MRRPTGRGSSCRQVWNVAREKVCEGQIQHLRDREKRLHRWVRRRSRSRLTLLELLIRVSTEAGLVSDAFLAKSTRDPFTLDSRPQL